MISQLYQLYLTCNGITTDSRSVPEKSMFFALSGPTFNGNEFAQKALDQGAQFAVVDEKEFAIDDRFILVDNALEALQQLASHHRDQLDIPVIAITGSNGKTTTKELIAAVLQTKYVIHYTAGNLNNHIGLPITLLSASNSIDLLILEMGANHIGEIADLCKIGKPTHGLITNIGRAHLEGFGSMDGVIQAKTELYKYISAHNGTVFVNDEDHLLQECTSDIEDIMYYGMSPLSSVYGVITHSHPSLQLNVRTQTESITIDSKLVGSYNFSNIMAALVVGEHFNVALKCSGQAIDEFIPKNNRSQIISKFGSQVILDAYNANPSSMEMAIQNIANLDGHKIVVLGDMMELGNYQNEEHRHIIDLVLDLNFDQVILVGEYFKEASKESDALMLLNNAEEVKKHLNSLKLKMDWILIKGSRKMQLENIVSN